MNIPFHFLIVKYIAEVGGDIIVIHEFTLSDDTCGMANRVTIFDDIFALCNVAEGEFMACWDARQVLKGYSYSIERIDFYVFLHVRECFLR